MFSNSQACLCPLEIYRALLTSRVGNAQNPEEKNPRHFLEAGAPIDETNVPKKRFNSPREHVLEMLFRKLLVFAL